MNAGPKGFRRKSGHPPQGNQPENWWAERRSFVSGNPVVFFNTAGALGQVTQERYTVSACLVLPHFDCAVSEVVTAIALFFLLPLLFFSPRFAFLCSLNAAPRFGRIFHFGIFRPIIRGRLDVDYPDHGPLRGRAAALSWIANSTCLTSSLSSSLVAQSTTGPVTHVSRDVHHCGRVWSVCSVMKPWSSCRQQCPAVGVCLPGCRETLS